MATIQKIAEDSSQGIMTLKATSTKTNPTFIWDTGENTDIITTAIKEHSFCLDVETSSIRRFYEWGYKEVTTDNEFETDTYRAFHVYEPGTYGPATYKADYAYTVTISKIKREINGPILSTHPTSTSSAFNNYYETLTVNYLGTDAKFTFRWCTMVTIYNDTHNEESFIVHNFDSSKAHVYTLVHRVYPELRTDGHTIVDIDLYIDGALYYQQKKVDHRYIVTYYWNWFIGNIYEYTKCYGITGKNIEYSDYSADKEYSNSYLDIKAEYNLQKPTAIITPQLKAYVEHIPGSFYATSSYDENIPPSNIVKYIWNGEETTTPIFTKRITKQDKITLKVVNAYGLESDEVEIDLSKNTIQGGSNHKFLFASIPLYLICYKGTDIFDILISRFDIATKDNDLYSSKYPTEYKQYTSIGLATDISTDTITYMACLPDQGVKEYTIDKNKVDCYALNISYLDKRNAINYFNKTKGNKGSLLACIKHTEMKEEGDSSLDWVLKALGIHTPLDRYTIPRLIDLLELLFL